LVSAPSSPFEDGVLNNLCPVKLKWKIQTGENWKHMHDVVYTTSSG